MRFSGQILRDRIRRLAPLTPQRLRNALALHAGFRRARRGGPAEQRALPMSLSIEPTTSCNLRCPECPSGLRSFTRPTGMLNPELLGPLLDELRSSLVYVNLYFQGEPTLHKQFDDLVRTCKARRVYTSTSTNAHYLTPERAQRLVASGLDRLIVSIDGTTQEAYAAYRVGGQLQRVLDGTRNVLEARRAAGSATPHVVWQFLVVGPNEHQVPEIRQLARDYGVDELDLKTAQLDDPHDGHPLLTENPAFRRYDRSDNGRWRLRNPLDNSCWRMWQGCVITWDGQVVPCCFDKDAHHSMGRVGDRPFREIWHSAPYAAFRQQLFTARADIPMCQNCSEGTEVYA